MFQAMGTVYAADGNFIEAEQHFLQVLLLLFPPKGNKKGMPLVKQLGLEAAEKLKSEGFTWGLHNLQ